MGVTAPALLTSAHKLTDFVSGKEDLDLWLRKRAWKSQQNNNARVYVVTPENDNQVIGYYAIAMGSVSRESSISNLKRNSPDPIPMVVLARLAVDQRFHNAGIGAGLLKDCVKRAVHAMNVVGGAGILVHAADDDAKRFYTKFGFRESVFDPLTLMARIKDIQAAQTRGPE